ALHMALGGAAVVHSSVRGLPDLREGTPVVLDGPQRSLSADDVARLRAHVDAGAALLAIGTAAHLEQGEPLCDLLGAHAEGSSLPRCEVFLSVAQPGAEMTRRLDTEFAIDDVVEPLQP